MRHLSKLVLSAFLVNATPSIAVEAVTSVAGRTAERGAIEAHRLLLTNARTMARAYEIEFVLFALSPDLQLAFQSSHATSLPQAGRAPLSLPSAPTDVAKLTEKQRSDIAKYAELRQRFLVATEYAEALARSEPTLEPLKTVPSLQVNTGNASAGVVPSIDFVGNFDIWKPNGLDGTFQLLVSIKPDPPAGTATEVAQSIRISTGVLSANFGINLSSFAKKESAGEGSLGFEFRAGVPVAYQRASTSPSSQPSSGTTTAGNATTDFGLVSPEVKVSFWLKSALLGYKGTYHVAFGERSDVYASLQRTFSHKAYLAFRLPGLSAAPTATAAADSPFYVECSYTRGEGSADSGTFSLALSKSLSWPTH